MQGRKNSAPWLFLVTLILALGLTTWGIIVLVYERDYALVASGAVSTLGVLVAWLLAFSIDRNREAAEVAVAPVHDRLQALTVLLNQISEQQLISERAKAIAFRGNERDAVRRAIREEIARKDWEAALALTQEIEVNFGYKAEAERLRQEIDTHCELEVRRQVSEAAAAVERYCNAEQWIAAEREAERILSAFPDDPKAKSLSTDIAQRRHAVKLQLMACWETAVKGHDVDGAIEILKRLDLYLSPQEAAGFQETARQIFKDKLLLLGQQFTVAMKEHDWQLALRLGETINQEFPNSRMAQEVRDKMELLKKRAVEGQPASV